MSEIKNDCSKAPNYPVLKVICSYTKLKRDEKKSSRSNLKALRTHIEACEMVRGYKLCCFNILEKTYHYYRDIDNDELHDMHKSCETIQLKLDTYIQKSTTLATGIKDASKLLNDLKGKLQEVNNEACKLHNCLKSIFNPKDLPKSVKEITDCSKQLSEQGQKAAESLAVIAGIQSFADLSGLKNYGQTFTEAMKAFKKQNDDLIKQSSDELKIAQTDLSNSITDLDQKEFELFLENSNYNALDMTYDFICKEDCKPIACIEDICKELNESPEEPSVPTPPTPVKNKGSKGNWAQGDQD